MLEFLESLGNNKDVWKNERKITLNVREKKGKIMLEMKKIEVIEVRVNREMPLTQSDLSYTD